MRCPAVAVLVGQEVDLRDGVGPRRVTVAAACRALGVPASTFSDWRAGRPPSAVMWLMRTR